MSGLPININEVMSPGCLETLVLPGRGWGGVVAGGEDTEAMVTGEQLIIRLTKV